jgi:ABC-2 type transport system ATP-binding protein
VEWPVTVTAVIEIQGLTKRFGPVLAVNELSFSVQPGKVTGFLGPNGSGKSTSMRCMVRLDRADKGSVTFGSRTYGDLRHPLHEVGTLLDAGNVHPGRSGRNHLRTVAASNNISTARVDEVLGLVGLADAAGRKVKGYSLGMKQRLGLAGALLGDPAVVMLDEPANGLDPEGIRWIRDFLKALAAQGRTVLVSSHLLSEMALMANELVVIGKGQLIEQCSVADFVSRHSAHWVEVQSPQASQLAGLLQERGAAVAATESSSSLRVDGLDAATVGDIAAAAGLVLHELSTRADTLEDAFLTATASTQEYRSGGAS